ncbi:Leucine_rich repeats-containing protein [Hexamita inflata]|uniref:Leucine rich repeats-containing protein n=2 Tax=Hexamita inflata TaxID=28002 RepID=A0AA86PGK7_9EUKA|nr:Leucine rich repeats-containing protein [Hexamita inflata]
MQVNTNNKQLSEYDVQMIKTYQHQIKNGELEISNDQNLQSLTFIPMLDINALTIYQCDNVESALMSDTVKCLKIENCNMESVDGLQLENLENLQLLYTNLINLQNIDRFRLLKELKISSKYIDLEGIQSLEHLTQLTIFESVISNIDVLKHLGKLTKLHLDSNDLVDLSVLKSLVNIEDLSISGNIRVDLTSLPYLAKLVVLNISNLDLQSVQFLDQYTQLKELKLSSNRLEDISSLQHMRQLAKLDLSVNNIKNLSIFSHLINIEYLDLSNNSEVDVEPLKCLVKLSYLNLNDCNITSISALRPLVNLKELLLTRNYNIDISSLQYFTNLTYLELAECVIYEISALRPLVKLQQLHLDENNIIDISPLENMQLSLLSLPYNKVQDFTPVNNHLNINEYCLDAQEEPTLEDLLLASQMHAIDWTTSNLRKAQKRHKETNALINPAKQKINSLLQILECNTVSFTNNVVALLQNINDVCQ